MVQNHMKRMAAPKTWDIKRKSHNFITKSAPGPHGLARGMPLNTLLKEKLSYANTTREAKKIINTYGIKVDGKSRKDFRFPVGVFDTIGFESTNEYFRVILDKKGKVNVVKIKKDEQLVKPCKIIGKTMVRGKQQLNLYDGKNILVDKGDYKIGDTILVTLPELKISKHFKLDKKSSIFLIGGRYMGETGNVEDIVGNKIIYRDERGNLIETSKNYAFVVGEGKPSITLG